MKTKLIILYTLITISCSPKTETEKDLREVINTQLNIEMFETIQHRDSFISMQQLRKKYNYLSIVYLQDGCSPCYPKFVEWHQKMKEMVDPPSIKYSEDNAKPVHTILFVIQTVEYENFIRKVRLLGQEIDEKYYIIIDPDHQFFINNNRIPDWIMNSSMLIDHENKIKMVGAPWINKDMTDLFHKIISQSK